MLKKILIAALSAVLAFSFVACGEGEVTAPIVTGEANANENGLPAYDFGDYEFNILSVGRGTVCTDDFAYEEDSANLLEQSI